ncbi:hypothetical protein ACF0H5_021415 [Mactra antiquata]
MNTSVVKSLKMVGIFTIFLLGWLDVGSCGGGHGSHPSISSEVDIAIQNLNYLYNDHFCRELLLVDCTTHVTVGDEKICGSNGVTYENHCLFAHAVCENLHSHNSIQLAYHGECKVTNAPLSTTTVMTKTTTHLVHAIIQNVFCLNAGSISCGSGGPIVCATDGRYYINQCEMTKVKCLDPSLTLADNSDSIHLTRHGDCDAQTTTTTMPPGSGTTNPLNSIVQSVFCQNIASISCGSGGAIVCGTDGHFYPNE